MHALPRNHSYFDIVKKKTFSRKEKHKLETSCLVTQICGNPFFPLIQMTLLKTLYLEIIFLLMSHCLAWLHGCLAWLPVYWLGDLQIQRAGWWAGGRASCWDVRPGTGCHAPATQGLILPISAQGLCNLQTGFHSLSQSRQIYTR